ncbi:MAG: hypothetical protein ACI3W5_12680 [Faecousia sp.]
MDEKNLKLDRMRYTKDKRSANMVLLAIVFNVLYYVSVYQQDHPVVKPISADYPYYSWMIGASIVLNLLFLLIGFLCSEGVKGRKTGYTAMLLGLGALQIIRIFYLPAKAKAATYTNAGETFHVMTNGQYTFAVVMLVLSGALCIAAALNSYTNNAKLAKYMKSIES